jgi:hypothetical protein
MVVYFFLGAFQLYLVGIAFGLFLLLFWIPYNIRYLSFTKRGTTGRF